jgi:hypothetical protein
MAKDKQSSGKSTAKKTAAKKSPAKKAAAPVNSAAEKIASTAPATTTGQPMTAPVRTPRPPVAELFDEIRRRAYEFFCERGGNHGSHEADWHRAEAEVRAKYKS